ncbi:MAG: leucine-rich repeat domain-containing protein [Clostridia bacterium]|nr:leucine-rich repeat domain-containing protein [Clostridia bacterium]
MKKSILIVITAYLIFTFLFCFCSCEFFSDPNTPDVPKEPDTSDEPQNTATYELIYAYTSGGRSGYYSVTGYSGKPIDVVFPEYYNGLPIRSIDKDAFKNCTSLTSVTIGSGVTTIGDSAFDGCTSLTSITIPSGVTSIGEGAFYDCTSLDKVYISDIATWCVISFNQYSNPLHYANKLYMLGSDTPITNLVIPEGVTTIPTCAFSSDAITSVTIPNSVTSIGYKAFMACTSLTSITIPNSVTSIDPYAFNGCTSLTSINIPSSVTSIGHCAFEDCSSLTSVTIGSGATSIGDCAFNGCTALTEINFNATAINYLSSSAFDYAGQSGSGIKVTIGKNVPNIPQDMFHVNDRSCVPKIISVEFEEGSVCTHIGWCAFENCTSLEEITIPNSVTSISLSAFENCISLDKVYISDIAKWCAIRFADEYSNPLSYAHKFYMVGSDTPITNLVIPDGVTSIGDYAFYDCTSLASVTIGSGVTSIGEDAFRCCYKLVEVYNLSNLNITKGSTSYGRTGYYALDIYTSTTATSKLHTTSDGYIFYEDGNTVYLVGCTGNSTTLILPDKYNGKNYAIYHHAFYCNNKITSVTIGSGVTSIGVGAFINCTALTEINFNATVMNDLTDDNRVFYNAGQSGSGIKVTIGKNVTKIPAYLFYPYSYSSSYDPKITSVEFEEGSVCTYIGEYAFYSCNSLDKVYISDIAKWCAISFANQSSNPLYYANKLYMVGSDTPITNLVIPDGVTSIGNYAFNNCISLESITIPSSVTSIGVDGAFRYCYKLVEVYNLSGLNITKGSESCGYVGYYALNIYMPDKGASKLHTTNDGYIFYEDGNTVYLVGYIGNSTALTLPDKYNGKNYAIYKYAFHVNVEITSVTIPSSVTSIGEGAFRGCTSLTSITIPNSVTTIGDGAFCDCTSLDKVYISDIAKWCAISFGDFTANPLSNANKLYMVGSDTPITNLVIPEGVTTIPTSAFSSDAITSVTIPSSVTTIDYYAFRNCTSLTSITIPSGVTSIGECAFYDCTSLDKVYISDIAKWCAISFGDNYSNPLYYATKLYMVGSDTPITNLVIPEGVTSIGNYAFEDCTSLTSITIPSSVTSIGNHAFSGCSSLTRVTFEKKSGWWFSLSSDATSGTSISATDLESASTAANYLKSTHSNFYWRRS